MASRIATPYRPQSQIETEQVSIPAGWLQQILEARAYIEALDAREEAHYRRKVRERREAAAGVIAFVAACVSGVRRAA
jgi:hypothetical protein